MAFRAIRPKIEEGGIEAENKKLGTFSPVSLGSQEKVPN